MPRLLRNNAIRLIEGSLYNLDLALSALAFKTRMLPRTQHVQHVPVVGLIGVSAELAMSACLVQVGGEGALRADANRYKTGGQILRDFRRMVRDPVPASAFLVQGIADATGHRAALQRVTTGFTPLVAARAAAVHGSYGLGREICLELAGGVSEFLQQLSLSSKIRPYLEHVPEPPPHRPDRTLLVEELARRIAQGGAGRDDVLALYLLLPEVTEDAPDWLDAFERVAVTPNQNDIDLLVRHLGDALPVALQRVRAGGATRPVAVQPNAPGAVPIAPHRLRASLRDTREQWYAMSSVANGRLEQGRLSPPNGGLVLDVFAAATAEELDEEQDRNAHRLWPLVLAAARTQGTPGPYWFLLRNCSDIGQLRALLVRASQLGSPAVTARVQPVLEATNILRTGAPVPADHDLARQLDVALTAAEEARESLAVRLDSPRAPQSNEGIRLVREVAERARPVGDALLQLMSGDLGLDEPDERYWARLLAEAAYETDDVDGLVRLRQDTRFTQAHTAARKAISLIDLLYFGPEIDGDD